jgi:hypothetical protein
VSTPFMIRIPEKEKPHRVSAPDGVLSWKKMCE